MKKIIALVYCFVRAITVFAQGDPDRSLLEGYCIGCHKHNTKIAGVALDTANLSQVDVDAKFWENGDKKLRSSEMPPVGMPRPDSAAIDRFLARLESDLDLVAAANPNPGRTEVFHRLNRAEYQNVVDDLLAVDIDTRNFLPADDAAYGFDNMARTLKLSQSLLKRYLGAAKKISRQAVGIAPAAVVEDVFQAADRFPFWSGDTEAPSFLEPHSMVKHTVPEISGSTSRV